MPPQLHPDIRSEKRVLRPEDIDWGAMWKEKESQLNPNPDLCLKEKHWDQIASVYQILLQYDEYPTRLLQRIQMQREWTVLDIGCGIGSITIPAAMRSRRVTALDVSARMLENLKAEANRRYLGNIQYLHQDWESIRIGVDIRPHDVVIASRSIVRTGDLTDSLRKINKSAKKFVYLTAWAGEIGVFNSEFLKILNREYSDFPDDLYLFNILREMGIYPNVEQIECGNPLRYKNPDEVIHCYQILFNLTEKEIEIASSFLNNHITRRKDGMYELPETRIIWSLFWWSKPELVP